MSAAQTIATFFGAPPPIFPPNGGFAPPDFYSENTLRIFAEAAGATETQNRTLTKTGSEKQGKSVKIEKMSGEA